MIEPLRTETSDGMGIDWDVGIQMDDGIVLRADVFRPIADGKYPAILTYGPYAKGLHFEDGYPTAWQILIRDHPEVLRGTSGKYANWEVVDPEKWVCDNFVCIRIDSRGVGRSPGVIDPWSPREARDCHDCVEWAAAQPWSNGRIGIAGVSYFATNAWHVAALNPPHLAAICVWEGGGDFYRDFTRQGGIVCDFLLNWYDIQVKSVQHGLGLRGARSRVTGLPIAGDETQSEEELRRNRVDFAQDILRHPLDDVYNRAHSANWSKVRVPLLSAGSWGGNGFHLRGNVQGFLEAASEQKWLEMHGLEHWTHFYTDYGVGLQKRFFSYFLKREPNGWDAHPRVQLLVRHPGERYVLRYEHEWPLARTKWTKMYLAPGGAELRSESPASLEQATFEAEGEGLTFKTSPMACETEICGPAAAKLHVSSTTTDADLFVVIRLFDEMDREVHFVGAADPHTPIAQGWLRASHRKLDPLKSTPVRPFHTHDEVWPLAPGQTYELDIEIWTTNIVIPAGYRLGFSVLGHDYEYGGLGIPMSNFKNKMKGCGPAIHTMDRQSDVYKGTTSIYSGPGQPSYILLPIIPTADASSS